jgi:para-nitrobenzyl esterase
MLIPRRKGARGGVAVKTSENPNVVTKLIGFISPICLGLAAICVIAMGWPQTAAAERAIVTEQGPLKSTNITTAAATGYYPMNATEYLGIPFALPAVGNLRWRPPQPPARFKGLFHANGLLTKSCAQPDGAGGMTGDENCLYLNVYVPNVRQPAHGFPVMVWIHGGGLVTGSGWSYDPQPLVDGGGVIVVTINYRLGYFGFFAHPALDAEGHLAGNYGLMDQQFALQWVQRNIEAFGGNRNRVTMFGESAGGLSVYSNLASPTAAGLFEGAIAESGAYVNFAGHFPFTDYLASVVPLATGESTGSSEFGVVPSGIDAAISVGCASQTAACLRAVPALALVQAEPGGVFPFVDGTVLTQPPGEAIGNGQFNRVPVISGSNHDEWRYFVALQYDLGTGPLTDANYLAAVEAFVSPPNPPFASLLATVVYPLTNYPPQPPGNQSAPLALGALGTDAVFVCPARNAGLSLAAYVPTYVYEFHDETAPSFFPPLSFPLGDSHFIEVLYLFNLGFTFTSDQQQLSNTMVGYWTQFAKTGNPNSTGAPAWSQYSSGGSIESLVAPTPVPELDASFDSNHKCSGFWDTF